jgi:hypothetical protein
MYRHCSTLLQSLSTRVIAILVSATDYIVAAIASFGTHSSATVRLAQLVKAFVLLHCVSTLNGTAFVAQTLQQQELVKLNSQVATITLLCQGISR